jgi:AraC-like DNA-binding protein
MCKAFHGRSGLHPMMLPQGLKYLARQMIVANGGVILRISGLLLCPLRPRVLESEGADEPYILLHKLETAKDLLSRTDQSLSQIALRSGFYAASDFGKRFREIERMTPRQYRIRQKEILHVFDGKSRRKVAHP